MTPKASILISSHNRLRLFKRTLWSIAFRGPSVPFEVVVADDGSDEDILGELRRYSSVFPWTFVSCSTSEFEQAVSLRKLWNNPCWTNNVAFKHSRGDFIFLQGNEVIAWGDVYNGMLEQAGRIAKKPDHWMVMSTTYDVPKDIVDAINVYGSDLTPRMVSDCVKWPLQSISYRSDVTNYLSLTPRSVWTEIGGYDERYYAGISAEDSDFVRRCRCLPGFAMEIQSPEAGCSLHQSHGGKTRYYDPPASVISPDAWKVSVKVNHDVYNSWDGTHHNRQTWPMGSLGIVNVTRNW